MKRWSPATLTLSGLVALAIGCNASTPGGPGAKGPGDKKPIVGMAEDTFNLDPPNLSTTLKQGESKTVTIGIKRGKNFSQDVALKFENPAKGLTIEPKDVTIKHGEQDAKLTLKAADDAALGDFTVKVTGHPASGADSLGEFKVKVEKK